MTVAAAGHPRQLQMQLWQLASGGSSPRKCLARRPRERPGKCFSARGEAAGARVWQAGADRAPTVVSGRASENCAAPSWAQASVPTRQQNFLTPAVSIHPTHSLSIAPPASTSHPHPSPCSLLVRSSAPPSGGLSPFPPGRYASSKMLRPRPRLRRPRPKSIANALFAELQGHRPWCCRRHWPASVAAAQAQPARL